MGRRVKSLALSHADACNPLLQAHPTWVQDNTKVAGFPLRLSPPFFPPSCSVSRRPIWAGTRSENLLVGPGTPQGRNADTFGLPSKTGCDNMLSASRFGGPYMSVSFAILAKVTCFLDLRLKAFVHVAVYICYKETN
jgi:hypothetical protein